MTKFLDGPAKGQTLMLKRAPKFLRVVHDGEKWDALDQPEDTPTPGETVYAYKLDSKPAACHVNFGSRGGGWYPSSSYTFCGYDVPTDMLRDASLWRYWCEHQKDPELDWKNEHTQTPDPGQSQAG